MKKTNRSRLRGYLKRHILTLGIVSVSLLGATGFLVWQNMSATDQIAQNNAKTQKLISETNLKIKEAKAKKLPLS